jgi:hypothetical protein
VTIREATNFLKIFVKRIMKAYIKMKLYSMVEKYKYKEEIGMLISIDRSLVWNKKRLLLFTIASRLGLGPISHFMFPQEYSSRSVKLTTHIHLLSRLRMVELYLHSPYTFMVRCLIN